MNDVGELEVQQCTQVIFLENHAAVIFCHHPVTTDSFLRQLDSQYLDGAMLQGSFSFCSCFLNPSGGMFIKTYPTVWDHGSLSSITEGMFIKSIIQLHIAKRKTTHQNR